MITVANVRAGSVPAEIVVGLVGSKMNNGRFHDPAVADFALNGFAAMFGEIARLTPR